MELLTVAWSCQVVVWRLPLLLLTLAVSGSGRVLGQQRYTVPAMRITCSHDQPQIGRVFCIGLETNQHEMVAHQCLTNTTIPPHKDGLRNSMLTLSLGKLTLSLGKEDPSRVPEIDVLIVNCPCSTVSQSRSYGPCHQEFGEFNFSCNYHSSGGSLNHRLPANVSHINMTSELCCSMGRCSNKDQEPTSASPLMSDERKGDPEACDRTVIALGVLTCIFFLVSLASIALNLYQSKRQRLQQGLEIELKGDMARLTNQYNLQNTVQ